MTAQRWIVVLGLSAAMGGAAMVVAQSNLTTKRSAEPALPTAGPVTVDDQQPASHPCLREGMRLSDALGHFESPGDVPVFVDEQGRRLAGLENLNLQRIVQALQVAEDPPTLKWKVTGTITEFEGRNFILIERAVYTPSRR